MLFDPAFAAAARRDPERVLAAVEPGLRAQLAALDDRALRMDRLRRRRALRTLSEEFKGATTLALAERRSLAFLEEFFCSAAFHRAVEERGSMALGFAEFLAEAAADGRLTTPLYADVLALETATARARRAAAAAPAAAPPPPDLADERVRVAPAAGVFVVEVAEGALAALQQAERYLFEVGLMPAVALCDDAPRLRVVAAPGARLHLVTVPHAGGVSLVTVDAELALLLRCLPGPRAARAVVDEAAARGLARDRARALLAELCADEIVVAAAAG
jgi:hypothetical protein